MALARFVLRVSRAAVAVGLTVPAALGGNSAAAWAGAERIEGLRAGTIPAQGYWAELPPPLRESHTAVVDPVRRNLIVVGGFDGSFRGDVWTLSLDDVPVWTRLEVTGPQPSARANHTAVFDPVRDRVLVFGGRSQIPYADVWLDDLWELSLTGSPTWTLLEPEGARPAARSSHTAIYDSARRRMVVFGGFGIPPGSSGREYQDTWAFQLEGTPQWVEVVPATPTPPRSSHSAVYDPAGDRMVIHGGTGGQPISSAAWSLSFATGEWQELLTSGLPPPDRMEHAAIFDPVRRRLVLFGGIRYENGFFLGENDVWALDLAGPPAWSRLDPAPPRPSPRQGHALAYDPATDRIVVTGGWDGQARGDVWMLPLSGEMAWVPWRAQEAGPVPREGAVGVYDPARKQVLLFGGRVGSDFVNDLWVLSLGARPEWRRVPAANPPPGRQGASLTYDPRRDRFLLYGGVHWGPPYDDLWQLRLSPTPAWLRLETFGPSPGGLGEHSAVYDPVDECLIVFGGTHSVAPRNGLWSLALAGTPRWSEIIAIGDPPPARSEHSAIYDPLDHRMIVFGGFYPYWNDVWELKLGGAPEWKWLLPLGSPPSARRGHTAAYDSAGRRMLVFGGRSLDPEFVVKDHDDLWELSLDGAPTWRILTPEGPPPLGRMLHASALDPRGNRIIVFGGESDSPFAFPAPTWQIVLGPAAPVFAGASVAWNRVRITWQSFAGAAAEVSIHRRIGGGSPTTTTRLADGEGVVTYDDPDVVPGERYEYWAEQDGLSSEPWFVAVPSPSLSLAGSRPSPARDDWVIDYSLRNSHPARLQIFDVRGRKVLDAPIPNPRPGDGTMNPGAARRLAAGVYLAKVIQDGWSASAKLAVIR